ncbi:MAG: hypothetical protein ACFFF4_09605 [Candidatus Thorarchaeota archaeon]
MSKEVTDLERSILKVIISDSHRASAITRILQGRHIDCDQNKVVQALNSLENKDLVERFTEKTWIAKGKAQDLVE